MSNTQRPLGASRGQRAAGFSEDPVAAAVARAEVALLAVRVVDVVEAGRCREVPHPAVGAECPKGHLVSAHARPPSA